MTMTSKGTNALSRVKLKGTLQIHVRSATTGRVIRTVTKRNVITFNAGDVMRGLIAQRASDPSAAFLQLKSMRFGTDNTTPVRANTDLISEVVSVRKELLDGQKVDGVSGEITLSATLQSGDGNGNTFQEAGLFTLGAGLFSANVGGSLFCFARQVHSALAKTSAIVLDYNWTIQFTT